MKILNWLLYPVAWLVRQAVLQGRHMSGHTTSCAVNATGHGPCTCMVQMPVEWRDALLAENQRLEDKCVSLTLEVEVEKHNHRKDNEYLLAENQRLRAALVAMRELASVSLEDPWYAEQAELDSSAIFKQAREALRSEQ